MATQYFSGLRQATPVGNGGTPDAVRYEALSGEQLHGKHHSKKCEELINRGQKLLNVHRDGLPSNRPRDRVKMSECDIRAVEHMVDELKSARSF